MRTLARMALALALTALALGPARATLLVPLDLDQMTERAHWIGVGTCTSVRSFWVGKQIWTEVSFRVDRPLKGSAGPEVRLRLLGGQVDHPVPVAMRVAGAPEFEVGETDLLFVERDPDGANRLVGFSQGRMPLRRDASGNLRAADGSTVDDLAARIEARLKAGSRP